jgi:CRP/FNR family transcriptional regulator
MQGFVQLSKTIESKNIPIRHISPMQLIGESVDTHENRYPLSAHFVTNGIAIVMEYKVCKQMLLWSPNIAMAMFNLINKSQQYLFQEMNNQKLLNSTQRVALFLLEHKLLLPQLMHKDMAMILSLRPETFSRHITKLKSNGYIVLKKNKFKLNEGKLRQLLE